MPRREENSSVTSNFDARSSCRPASMREVEEVVDELAERLGARTNEPHLLLLLGREVTVEAIEEELREAEDRVDRRAELVAHVRHDA